MGRKHAFRASFVVALATAGLWAGTSVVHAIDPDASAARQAKEQQSAAQLTNVVEDVARMKEQIAQMDEELAALRDHHIQLQQERRATNSANGPASHAPMTTQ